MVKHAFSCLFRGNMETKNTLLEDSTVKRLRKLLRSFDKFNSKIDIYEACIKKKFEKLKEE